MSGRRNRLGQFVTDGRKDVQGGKAGDIPDVIPDDHAVCAVVNDCYTNEPNEHDTRDEDVVLKSFFFIEGLITGSRRGMAETDVLSVGYYDTVRPTNRL